MKLAFYKERRHKMKYRIDKFSDSKYCVYIGDRHIMNVWKESKYWKTSISADNTYNTRVLAIESNLSKM